MILDDLGTLLAHIVDMLLILVARLAHVVDGADSGQARGIVIKENVGKMSLVAEQIRRRKCPVGFTYKTTFLHIFGTCSRHVGCFDHPSVVEILIILTAHRVDQSIGSASTPPNVKITTKRIVSSSRLVALVLSPVWHL